MTTTKDKLKKANLDNMAISLTYDEIDKIVRNEIKLYDLSDEQLVSFLQVANALYRSGDQIITDADYDFIYVAELRRRNPRHPYLHKVEPEVIPEGKKIRIPVKMLSTDKAYTENEIIRWFERIKKAANETEISINEISIRVTPKLDGFAAYDDGNRLYTRGDGRYGTDISRVFERGLLVRGNNLRGQGAGEIVVSRTYFKNCLAQHFENSRNFQASLIKEKELDPHTEKAIREGEAVFFPFSQLPAWEGSLGDLEENFEKIINDVWNRVEYDVDGVVLEVTNGIIKSHMGATRHHHRWQIAFKKNTEKTQVNVRSVIPQTARTGRVTPVVQFEPTRLSGATLYRVTAHHYGMVRDKRIGPGARIELVRSGLVIPKIVRVIESTEPEIPTSCPACEAELVWDADFLLCPNIKCSAQVENRLEHFFKMIKNADGFGPKTIQKLYEHNVDTVSKIYEMKAADFRQIGFGDKTSSNMEEQLLRSRTEPIEDWRFLAAFGVFRMGLGNCERLLQHYRLEDVFQLSTDEIILIEGFAETTANIVVKGLQQIEKEFHSIYSTGFNLERTPTTEKVIDQKGPLAGKTIVFTGKMLSGIRPDLEKAAKKLGAKIGKSVTGNTDYLITGENVGANKINAARENGVEVITEQDYLSLIDM